MRIYLSGPISLNGTLPPEECEKNLERFHEVALKFRQAGYLVVSPAEVDSIWGKQPNWEAYMKVCVKWLCDCDILYLLPGWEKSRGSVFELLVATTIGIDVEVYDEAA